MAKEKEEKILDDIEKRCEDLQSRIGMIEKPLQLLTAWIHANKGNIDTLFANAATFRSWYSPPPGKKVFFDELEYSAAASKIFGVLEPFHKKMKQISSMLLFDFREVKRAENKLVRIEREELALSAEEKGKMRQDVLGELRRVKDCEKRFNQIIGSIRLFWAKTRELVADLAAEKELYADFLNKGYIKKLKDDSRMEKIEKEFKFMRDIIAASSGTVQTNLTRIGSSILTLQSHVPALKQGAKYVTIPA